MPAALRPAVSATDYVGVVRAYGDRVHDLARRGGAAAAEASRVVENSALDLLAEVRGRPEEVGDLVGAWFARAGELTERAHPDGPGEGDAGADTGGVLGASEEDYAVGLGLSELTARDREALLLTDAYDLPMRAVSTALELPPESAAAVVGAARLRLLDALGARRPPVPPAAGHRDIATLGRLVDPRLDPERSRAARKHVAGCPACCDVVDAEAEARRLLTGLAIVGLSEAGREEVLARVAERAVAVLPTADEVATRTRRAAEPQRVLRPSLVIGALLLALLAGAAIGALTAPRDAGAALPAGLGRAPAVAATRSSATTRSVVTTRPVAATRSATSQPR